MKKYGEQPNELVFTLDDYDNDEERMWKDIASFLKMLMQTRNIATVKADELGFGIFVISYEADDESYGSVMPYWIKPDDYYTKILDDEAEEPEE